MRVKILRVDVKDVKTKAGAAMQLREMHGYTQDGSVFKTLAPRDQPDLKPGDYEVTAEASVNWDSDLVGRIKFTAVGAPAQK